MCKLTNNPALGNSLWKVELLAKSREENEKREVLLLGRKRGAMRVQTYVQC